MKDTLTKIIEEYNLNKFEFRTYMYNTDATINMNNEQIATIISHNKGEYYSVVQVLIVDDIHISHQYQAYNKNELALILKHIHESH